MDETARAEEEARLAQLEASARRLEPEGPMRQEWAESVLAFGESFLEGLEEAPTFVAMTDPDPTVTVEQFGLSETGHDLRTLLAAMPAADRVGINPASGGHIGYIPGGGLYPSALADYLADITNRYSGVAFAGPSAARAENQMIRWMRDLVGYPQTAWGDLTSGGSIANLTAIVTARTAGQVRSADLDQCVIYQSEQTHHCVAKALRIAGFGDSPVRHVPLDGSWAIDVRALADLIARDRGEGLRPFMVVASAGTTDTGAVDPLGPLADLAAAEGLWLHVDAAYGGFFLLVEEMRTLFSDLHRADSVVLDPHKGLFLPYGSGAVLVRDGRALENAFSYDAAYLRDAAGDPAVPSPANFSPELTRPYRGLRMWLPLHLFGLAPFRDALREKLALTRYFHTRVQDIEDIEVGVEPVLSVSCFRWSPPGRDPSEATRALTEALHRDGRVFFSSTTLRGEVWLRCAVLCFRTHRRHIDVALDMIGKAIRELGTG